MRRFHAAGLGVVLGLVATSALAGDSPVLRRASRTDLLKAPKASTVIDAGSVADPTRSSAAGTFDHRVTMNFEEVGPGDALLTRGSMVMEGFLAQGVKPGLGDAHPSIAFDRVSVSDDEDFASVLREKTPARLPVVDRVSADSVEDK